MDRNLDNGIALIPHEVALRKESVDRNIFACYTIDNESRSLSARRAWIEIPATAAEIDSVKRSLSARRAWIEIIHIYGGAQKMDGRSPQGERG